MFLFDVATVGNGSLHLNSGDSIELATQNYNLIRVINDSAEEHQALNDFYQQTNAVSTVRLLQLAQSRGLGIVPLNVDNYVAVGETYYQGNQLQNFDSSTWSAVTAFFQNYNTDYGFVTGYITPGLSPTRRIRNRRLDAGFQPAVSDDLPGKPERRIRRKPPGGHHLPCQYGQLQPDDG